MNLNSAAFQQYLVDNYTNGTKSVPEIAEEYKTYPNKVYRMMRKWGIARKDKTESQSIALKTGRIKHPTEGKERDAQTKRKIGRAVYQSNKKLSPEERRKRVDKIRELWYNLPEKTRLEYTKKSHNRIRQAGQKGSKLEREIVVALLAKGYKLQTHHKMNFIDSEMTVDILLPVEGIVIEIDGPVHFEPIFGEENFDEQIKRDLFKNEQLISEGYSLIRIQNPKGYTSLSFIEEFLEKFLPFLKQVSKHESNTFHEICITDNNFSFKGD